MNVYYLFSKNNQIGSRLISWASGLLIKELEDIPSHTAILIEFDDVNESFVIESVICSGVRIIPFTVWKKKNSLLYKIPCKKKSVLRDIFTLINNIWGQKYDWLGLCFFGFCFVRYFAFKTPFPKQNLWESPNRYFCTEAVAEISGYEKAGMTTPAKMCLDLLKELENEP